MVYFPTCTIISIQTRKYKYTIHGWYGNTPHPNTSVISPSQQCQWLPWILATLPCLPNKITAGNRDWDGKKKHLTKHVQYCSWWKIQKFGISYHFFCWKLTFEPQKKSFPCIYTLLQTWHLPVSGRLVFGKMSFFHRNMLVKKTHLRWETLVVEECGALVQWRKYQHNPTQSAVIRRGPKPHLTHL